MKVLVVLAAFAAIAYAKSAGPIVPNDHTAYGYLKNIGVPEAERIQKAEEALLSGESRIIGGVPAALGQYPYQAGLISDIIGISGRGVCGGSLISPGRILTAAHCWFDGNNQAWRLTVVLGSELLFSGGTRMETSAVVMHPNWIPLLARNDIGVIYLPYLVSLSDTIATIGLPTADDANLSFSGYRAIASGFGVTSSDGGITTNQFLSHVGLNVISNTVCTIAFPLILQDSHICTSGTGGVGVCGGDSGGPLIITRSGTQSLIGVVSFGSGFGCESGYPSAFTRVTSFLTFIHQHL